MTGDASKAEAHFRMLVGVCWADGELVKREHDHLLRSAERLGLSVDRAQEIMSEGPSASLAAPPTDPQARLRQFLEMVRLAFTDGVVADEERAFLETAAERYGIPLDKVREILDVA